MRRVSVIDPVRVLTGAWRQLVLAAVIGALAVVGVGRALPRTYSSSVEIQVVQSSSLASASADTAARQLGTELELAKADSVIAAVALKLGLPADTVRDDIKTAAADLGDLFSITAKASSPSTARDLAQSTATEFVAERAAASRASLQSQLTQAQATQQALTSAVAAAPADQKVSLNGALTAETTTVASLQSQLAGNQPEVRVVSSARLGLASSPGTATTGILGIVLGLLIAAAVVLFRATRGDRLTSTSTILAATGLPLLAEVPYSRVLTGAPGRYHLIPLESDGVADSVRGLEIALRSERSGARMVLVTSAGRYDGKTTVATQLAVASAAAGLTTVLVVADTRAPAQLPKALSGRPGLLDALGDPDSPGGLVDVLAPVDRIGQPLPSLLMVPLGSRSGRGSDLIRGPRTRALLNQLTEVADVVIVDGPALSVPEGLALAGAVGEVVLCVGTHDARRQVLSDTLDAVAAAGATTMGVVVVDVEDRIRPENSDYGTQDVVGARRLRTARSQDREGRPAVSRRPGSKVADIARNAAPARDADRHTGPADLETARDQVSVDEVMADEDAADGVAEQGGGVAHTGAVSAGGATRTGGAFLAGDPGPEPEVEDHASGGDLFEQLVEAEPGHSG